MTNGWQEVPLKEVAKPISRPVPMEAGTTFRTLGVKWWGMGAYERESIDGLQTAAKTLSIVREGDLIINKIWVRHGSVAIAGKDVDGCAGSGEFPTFELDLNRIDPRWIHWQTKMKSFWEKCDNLSRGTSGKNRIKPELFLTITIPLPQLTEQRRIVAHIESLAARVNEAQHLREEAEIEREAIEVSARNEIFSYLAKTIKPSKFEEIAEMRLGKMLSQASKISATPLPYLRNANIQWDRLDLSNVNSMDFSEDEKPIFRLKAGDILVCEGGDIGKSAIWNDELPECYFQKALHRIRVNTKLTFPRFVLHHIFWAAEQNHFFGLKTQTTIPHLTGVKLKAYDIYLPPLDEQRRIVAYLDDLQGKVNELRELQSASGEELSALMPSILDKAFKGEL
jgi:type I restriction enzyme, S subunit